MRIDGSLRNDLNVFIENQYDLSNSQPSLPAPQRKERDDLGAKTSLNDTKVTINTDTPTWNEASIQRLFAEEFYILTFNEANKQLEQNFRKELDDLQIKIDNRLKRVENLGDAKDNFDTILKSLYKNKDNFLPLMRLFLSEEDYELVDLFLKDEYDLIKESDPIFPILKNAVKIYYDNKGIRELSDLKVRHDKILKIKKSEQALVDKLDKELSDRIKSSLIKGGLKSTELMICKLIPIIVVSLVKSSDNKQIGKVFKQVFKLYKKGSKVLGFKDNYAKKNRWTKELEPKIRITPEFPDIVNSKTSERTQSGPTQIDQLLEKKKADFERKFLESLDLLEKLHSDHSHLNFADFKALLNQRGFNLDGLENAPQSSNEWAVCFQQSSFKQYLSRRNVEHQMTVAKFIQAGLEEVISKKIDIESNLLIFNLFKNSFEMIVSLVQIALFVPKCATLLATWGIHKLEENLSIPGIEYAFVINPDIDLSITGLFCIAISHFFGSYFKPNEYSAKGYWIDFQNKLAWIYYHLQFALLFIMKWSLKTIDVVIDFCLKNKYLTSKTHSYDKLNDKLKQNREIYTRRCADLENQLNALKLKDIKQTLNRKLNLSENEENHILREYLSDNNFPKVLLREFDVQLKQNKPLDSYILQKIDSFLIDHHLLPREKISEKISKKETIYQFDKIQVMIDALQSSELSLFPEEVIEFFRVNLDISLKDDFKNSKLVDQMNEFFLAADKNFFKLYQEVVKEESPSLSI